MGSEVDMVTAAATAVDTATVRALEAGTAAGITTHISTCLHSCRVTEHTSMRLDTDSLVRVPFTTTIHPPVTGTAAVAHAALVRSGVRFPE